MKKIFWLISLFFLTPSSSSAAPVLQTDLGGQLIGVKNILVESGGFSEVFDVSFLDGSCISLFGGCDSVVEDLTQISTHHGAANAALLVAIGAIADSPSLIRGCESSTDCLITTPSNINLAGGGSVSGGTLWIRSGPANDLPISESFAALRETDLIGVADRTYAVWTSAVPVPAAVWLFGAGILGLSGFAKRKR